MNKEQSDAFIMTGAWILIGSCFISIIVWFISIGIQNTAREKLKHETCMVVTLNYQTINSPVTEVTAYCGDKTNGQP